MANALSSHVLPTSATMVGVCVTVLSIVKLASPGTLGYVIDKLLALGSLVFLASATLSFMSIRSQALVVLVGSGVAEPTLNRGD